MIIVLYMGKHIEANNYTACIFLMGTRTKDGLVTTFQPAGIALLIRSAPLAVILPFAIDGNSGIMKNGCFPMTFGSHLKFTVRYPIEPEDWDTTLHTENSK